MHFQHSIAYIALVVTCIELPDGTSYKHIRNAELRYTKPSFLMKLSGRLEVVWTLKSEQLDHEYLFRIRRCSSGEFRRL